MILFYQRFYYYVFVDVGDVRSATFTLYLEAINFDRIVCGYMACGMHHSFVQNTIDKTLMFMLNELMTFHLFLTQPEHSHFNILGKLQN